MFAMNSDDFEERMRAREYFHSLRLVPGTWTIVRVDGRSFSRFTETNCEKPFDPKFHDWMIEASCFLLEEFGALYVYTESDETSMLLGPDWAMFDREVEKTVSLTAGAMSAAFTKASGILGVFDSRLWVGASEADVIDYFRWRQSDCARCALNGWAYWTLRKEGLTEKAATAQMEGATPGDKQELLLRRRINFDEVPLWQRRGSGLLREVYEKEGRNPLTGEVSLARRRRVRVIDDLPVKDEYTAFLQDLLLRVRQERETA
jgi:tRNA(His) 5'-end guanylyltransferase